MSTPKSAGLDPALIKKHLNDSAQDEGADAGAGAGRPIPDVPLAQARNHTPFPSQYFQTVDQHGEVFHVIALKVTYDMSRRAPDGSLAYAHEQAELSSADVWSGEVGHSNPLWESDYAPYKPQCDVLIVNAVSRPPPSEWRQVVGRHLNPAPEQRRAKRWQTGIGLNWTNNAGQAQRWAKTLTVTGPRHWGVFRLSEPEPTHQVAIAWENAFGGTHQEPAQDILKPDGSVQTEAGAWVDRIDPRNPVGKGIQRTSGQPAPQLEVSAWDPYHGGITQGQYPPVGLSAVARHWLPRRPLAGTYDNAWLKDQWPLPPLDFDYAYWNCAPADQQVDYPTPGTEIRLHNLFGEHQPHGDDTQWQGRLPMHQLFVHAYHHDIPGRGLDLGMDLDTLVVDLAAQQIRATHRLVMPATAHSRTLNLEMRMSPAGRPNDSVSPDALGPLG